MQLKNLWNEKNVTLSFEVFPNKKDSDFETATFDELRQYVRPDEEELLKLLTGE